MPKNPLAEVFGYPVGNMGQEAVNFDQLPLLSEVNETEAEIAWFIYDLNYTDTLSQYKLKRVRTKYTKFKDTVNDWQSMI